MTDSRAKLAVRVYQNSDRKPSTRDLAQDFGVSVPEIHEAARCTNGKNCDGKGCRLGR